MFRVGTCAFTDHQGLYPPGIRPAQRLAFYAAQFALVEIDVTFYRPMARATAVRWRNEVPATFRFDVKAPGSMTGHRPPDDKELTLFRDFLEPLAEDGLVGAVLLQWPPWFRDGLANRALVEAGVQALKPFLAAVEFRHRSWYQDPLALVDFLGELAAVHVVVDAPAAGATTVPWYPAVSRPGLSYVRFHGRNAATWNSKGLRSSQERFNYHYAGEELEGRVADLTRLEQEAGEVHVLLNNNYGHYAVDAARWFRDRLAPLSGTQLGWSFD